MANPQPTLPVRIARAERIAADIHLFELRPALAAALPAWTAGSHIGVWSPNGSVRKYSLCNDPAETDRYWIAVKRDPAGRGGSVDLVDNTHPGDMVSITPPHNAFDLAAKAQSFVFIAGGIGITPIMSMMRALNADGRRYKAYYLTRSRGHTAFADELDAPDFRGKVVMHHDGGDPRESLDLWPILEKPSPAHVYCCGPRGMLEAVRDMTGHWSRANIHFESFVDAGHAAQPTDQPFTVKLARSGERLEVAPGKSILEAMREHGHDAPSSCESGTCGTCRTALLEGVADHRDLVLMDDEKDSQIMICVSRARSAEIAIDR
jgi:phthalate 4,5-dioxygenase reductase subunit